MHSGTLEYFVQAANHKDHSQSFSIFDAGTAKIHARSDRWLRTFSKGPSARTPTTWLITSGGSRPSTRLRKQ